MPMFRDSKDVPVSGFFFLVTGFILYGVSAAVMLLNRDAIISLLIPAAIGGIMLAIGVIRVAVAGAMYRLEEQNRRIIELLKQIEDNTRRGRGDQDT